MIREYRNSKLCLKRGVWYTRNCCEKPKLLEFSVIRICPSFIGYVKKPEVLADSKILFSLGFFKPSCHFSRIGLLDNLQKKEIKAPEKSITFQPTPDNNIQENIQLLECVTPNYLHEYTKAFYETILSRKER